MRLLSFTLTCLLLFVSLTAELPKLTLFFDINHTIVLFDTAEQRAQEDSINELLAKHYQACWDSSLTTPVSFVDYTYDILIPGSREDQGKALEAKKQIHHFVQWLEEHDSPLFVEVNAVYQRTINALHTNPVFPSFFRLLEHLNAKDIKYSIVLRTFGFDLHKVRELVHPYIPGGINFSGQFLKGTFILEHGHAISDTFDSYCTIERLGHMAVQDDYSHWHASGRQREFGKPFIVDRTNKNILEIFFDDNLHILVSPREATTGAHILLEELISTGQAVHVDTFEAVSNPDYFIDKVNKAIELQNHGSLL